MCRRVVIRRQTAMNLRGLRGCLRAAIGGSAAGEPPGVEEPALHPVGFGHRVDLEDDRLDLLDRPAVGEGVDELVTADAARPPVAGLAVAEAQEIEVSAGAEGGVEPVDVPLSVVV